MRLGLYIRGAYIVVKSSIYFFFFLMKLGRNLVEEPLLARLERHVDRMFFTEFFPLKNSVGKRTWSHSKCKYTQKNIESGLSNEPTEALARYSRTTLKALVTSKFSSFLPGGLQRQFGICTHVCVCVSKGHS